MRKLVYILLLVLVSPLWGDGRGAAQNIDSLKLVLKNAKHDTTRCQVLIKLIEGESEEKIWAKYNDELLSISKRNLNAPDKQLRYFFVHNYADALNNVGYLESQHTNVSKTLEYYQMALKYRLEINDKEGIATSYNNIGFVFNNQGDVTKALEYYHKSLKIYEAIKADHPNDVLNQEGLARALNNIGFIYSGQEDVSKAMEYFSKSLSLHQKMGNKDGISSSLNNIGSMYKRQNKFSEALQCYTSALNIQKELNNKKGIARSLNNIGSIYREHGDPTCDFSKADCIQKSLNLALSFFQKSLTIREEIQDNQGIANSLDNIARTLIHQGLYDQAFVYAKRSFIQAQELGFPSNIKNAAETLKKIYRQKNKHKEALQMFELEIQMRDSINNAETKKASIKKQFQYEYEKRAAADSVKNAEQQKVKNAELTAQRAQLKQERTQRFALYGGLVLVILFSAFVFNRFKITQRQKLIIEKQKHEVDLAYEKLHEKNKEVMDSIMYARRIQRALLTPEKYIEKQLNKLNNKN